MSYIGSQERLNKVYVYLVSAIAAVGGFLFGYDLSIISGAAIFLRREFDLNSFQMGLAMSSALIGCVIGPLFGGGLSDRFGRKRTLVLTSVLFGVSAVGTALPRNILEFDLFRIVGGVGVGLASVVSPMYIAEISPARIRGRLVTINQLAIVVGSLSSIIVSYFLSFSESWRWMFASECAPVLLFAAGLAIVPESPRWLVQRKRLTEALDVLARIEDRERAELEVKEISSSLTRETSTLRELLRPGMRTALLIAVALAVFQQITGVSTLLFYTPIIFQRAGFEQASNAILQTIIVNVWNLSCTILALWLVDRLGRRPLLLFGTAAMGVGMILMGALFHLNLSGTYLLLVMFLCVGAYVVSLAPLAWLIMSEIFPTRIRGKAMAVASLSLWISAFVSVQAFPSLVEYLEKVAGSPAGAFWAYAVVCICAFIFGWRMVPETKGRTLEEIASSWTKCTNSLPTMPEEETAGCSADG
ncbi:MAG: sugar porter family MFS transporter [Armatimonadetes bacterium]|nr:sugar porter family MFS transporter [Armatimonadota bacterium]